PMARNRAWSGPISGSESGNSINKPKIKFTPGHGLLPQQWTLIRTIEEEPNIEHPTPNIEHPTSNIEHPIIQSSNHPIIQSSNHPIQSSKSSKSSNHPNHPAPRSHPPEPSAPRPA